MRSNQRNLVTAGWHNKIVSVGGLFGEEYSYHQKKCWPCLATSLLTFKRVVARRAVYHTLNVITISLYVRLSVCVEWV